MSESRLGLRALSKHLRSLTNQPDFLVDPEIANNYKTALIEAIDAMEFPETFMKKQFDKKHQSFFLKVEDFVLLRLR